MNKKVRNTGSWVYNNIRFRSKFEMRVYQEMEKQGVDFEYEPEKVLLLQGFKCANPYFIDSVEYTSKVRATTYTPDYKAKIGDYTVYIEAKGYCTDRYILKRKLFLDKIKDDKSVFFIEVHSIMALRNSLTKIRELCERN